MERHIAPIGEILGAIRCSQMPAVERYATVVTFTAKACCGVIAAGYFEPLKVVGTERAESEKTHCAGTNKIINMSLHVGLVRSETEFLILARSSDQK